MMDIYTGELESTRLKYCAELGRKFYTVCCLIWKYSNCMNVIGDIKLFCSHDKFGHILFSSNRRNHPFNSMESFTYDSNMLVDFENDDDQATQTIELFSAHLDDRSFYVNIYKHLNKCEYFTYHSKKNNLQTLKFLYPIISKTIPVEINVGSFDIIGTDGNPVPHRRFSIVFLLYMSDEFINFIRRFTSCLQLASSFYSTLISCSVSNNLLQNKLEMFYSCSNMRELNLFSEFSIYRK